jgi:hypothetical protein
LNLSTFTDESKEVEGFNLTGDLLSPTDITPGGHERNLSNLDHEDIQVEPYQDNNSPEKTTYLDRSSLVQASPDKTVFLDRSSMLQCSPDKNAFLDRSSLV